MTDARTEWWVRSCAAKALDGLALPYQAAAEGEEMPESMRKALYTATNTLLSMLPAPTGYAVIGSGTPRMYRREFSTMRLAREDAEALARTPDHEHVTIRAIAPDLAWNVMRVK